MTERWDAIEVVEQAYMYERADEAWLHGVLRALAPGLDSGLGLVGIYYDVSKANRPNIWGLQGMHADARLLAGMARLAAGRPASSIKSVFRTEPFATTVQKLRRDLGTAFAGSFQASLQTFGISDILDLNGQNPDGTGCLIGAPLLKPHRLGQVTVRQGERIAAHVAAGLRLRQRLATSHGHQPTSVTDAILSPNGKLEHAEGEAKERASRTALRDAAVAADRARGKLRHRDPDAALELWRSLVAGRWTLVDRIESDGRRLIIAERNDPEAPGSPNLARLTRQVLLYGALGHSPKVIAYELGVSRSTVSRQLARGMAALGLRNSGELRMLLGVSELATSNGGPTPAAQK